MTTGATCLVLILFCLVINYYSASPVFPIYSPKLRNITRKGSKLTGGGWPVILVPGDGGSQLEAKLNRSSVRHPYWCYKTTDTYFVIWLNLNELLWPYLVDCWVDNMMLQYDNVTHSTSDSDGVDIRVPGWGQVDTVAYLDPSRWRQTQYFHSIVDMAVAMGYTPGKNIRGAPYDFRRAPNEFQIFYENMTALIEETYYQNGNKKVVIVAHSMGNPVMLRLYHSKPQPWKDKFIKAHVSVAGPWGGSVKTLKLFASGYNLDHYRIFVNPLQMRPFQRTMTSSSYLMPSPSFWSNNETLVITEKKNYTVADYQQFFDDIGFPTGWNMYQDTKQQNGDYKPPGVEVHCLCGTQLATPDAFEYSKNAFPDSQPKDVNGDGDGTVNLRSLRGCLRWNGTQSQPVYYKEFPKEEHLQMLSSPNVIAYLKTLLTSTPNEWADNVRKMVSAD